MRAYRRAVLDPLRAVKGATALRASASLREPLARPLDCPTRAEYGAGKVESRGFDQGRRAEMMVNCPDCGDELERTSAGSFLGVWDQPPVQLVDLVRRRGPGAVLLVCGSCILQPFWSPAV